MKLLIPPLALVFGDSSWSGDLDPFFTLNFVNLEFEFFESSVAAEPGEYLFGFRSAFDLLPAPYLLA
jgi:hypothetical protein